MPVPVGVLLVVVGCVVVWVAVLGGCVTGAGFDGAGVGAGVGLEVVVGATPPLADDVPLEVVAW